MKWSEILYRAAVSKAEQAKVVKKKRETRTAVAIAGQRRKSLLDAAKTGLVVIPNKIRKRFSGAVR